MNFLFKINLPSKSVRSFCNFTHTTSSVPTGNLTDLHIYQTTTNKKKLFLTQSKNSVTWYVCGPTVYDSAHIGHASTYMRFDIIRRILKTFVKKNVIQVMCITNIDDKIISRSLEKNMDWKVLTDVYEKDFFLDLDSLNILKPTIVARATDFIPQVLHFVEVLLNKNLAYVAQDGTVYFDSQRYGKAGKFRSTEVQYDELGYKKCSSDFALWKAAKPKEPFWNSSWGPGRPGWHIECSAMASHYFGGSLDLHSGGYDLMFPHHQNEETQCCAFHGVDQWVNYWVHVGQLFVNGGQKMSKSLGNSILIKEFLKSYSSNHFRMLCCLTNYRSSIQFDEEVMNTSVKYCKKLTNFFENCEIYLNGQTSNGNIDGPKLLQILDETKCNISKAVLDDFDTETGVTKLLHLVDETNAMLLPETGVRCPVTVAEVCNYVSDILTNLGFNFDRKNVDSVIHVENCIDSAVTFRDSVRQVALECKEQKSDIQETYNNLYKLCDNFRTELQHQGIIIKDRKNSKSTWTYTDLKKNISSK